MSSAVIDRLRAYFAEQAHDVVAAYVFGSEGRGEARPDSDVDLGVLLGHRPPATLLAQRYELADELRGLLGRPVDLVILDTAPPDLVHRVLRDGVIVVDRDRAARIRFEVAARNAYFDLQPFLDRYRNRAGREPGPR